MTDHIEDVKKDHSIGAGTGAVGGAITGAAVGSVAGPVGTLVGAVVGGVVGAKAGDSVAEMINPTVVDTHLKTTYNTTSYYNPNRPYSDFSPAYQYGTTAYTKYSGQRFEDVEPQLEREWAQSKAHGNLAWNEARAAVRDGWHYVERAVPGDFDRDGR